MFSDLQFRYLLGIFAISSHHVLWVLWIQCKLLQPVLFPHKIISYERIRAWVSVQLHSFWMREVHIVVILWSSLVSLRSLVQLTTLPVLKLLRVVVWAILWNGLFRWQKSFLFLSAAHVLQMLLLWVTNFNIVSTVVIVLYLMVLHQSWVHLVL